MRALVQAEVLKLRSARMTGWLVIATLVLATLAIFANLPTRGTEHPLVALDDPTLLAAAVGDSFAVGMVLLALLGGLAFTQEFRYGTATSTYLCEPRRVRVLVAKWLSLALCSVVIAVGTLVFATVLAGVLIRSRGGVVVLGAQYWEVVAASFGVMAAYGVMGVAVGALVRNQIVTVVGVLVWMLAVEQITIPVFPTLGQWMPGAGAFSLLQIARISNLDGKLLSAPAGGLLLLGYTAAAVVLALLVTPKRDVL